MKPKILSEKEIKEFVEKYSEALVKQCKLVNINLDYSVKSIALLDGFLEDVSSSTLFNDERHLQRAMATFGSYLGETVRKLHGGRWGNSEEDGMYLDVCEHKGSHIRIWPLSRIKKRLLNGKEDSIKAYYQAVVDSLKEFKQEIDSTV